VFAELNAKEDFDTFYAALLEKVNDEAALEELMALTTEQIFALIAMLPVSKTLPLTMVSIPSSISLVVNFIKLSVTSIAIHSKIGMVDFAGTALRAILTLLNKSDF